MKMKELRLGYQDLDFRILSLNRKLEALIKHVKQKTKHYYGILEYGRSSLRIRILIRTVLE